MMRLKIEKHLNPAPPFRPGFRVSVTDALILIAGAVGSAFLWEIEWWLGMIVGFVVGHFFPFCNVFRISRRSELIWALVFVVLVVAKTFLDGIGWVWVFSGSILLAVVLIALDMKKPSYHGIFWRWINPGSREWWKQHGLEH